MTLYLGCGNPCCSDMQNRCESASVLMSRSVTGVGLGNHSCSCSFQDSSHHFVLNVGSAVLETDLTMALFRASNPRLRAVSRLSAGVTRLGTTLGHGSHPISSFLWLSPWEGWYRCTPSWSRGMFIRRAGEFFARTEASRLWLGCSLCARVAMYRIDRCRFCLRSFGRRGAVLALRRVAGAKWRPSNRL